MVTMAQNYATSCELTKPLTILISTGMELGIHTYAKASAGAWKMQQKWKESTATTLMKHISMAAQPIDAHRMMHAKETEGHGSQPLPTSSMARTFQQTSSKTTCACISGSHPSPFCSSVSAVVADSGLSMQ